MDDGSSEGLSAGIDQKPGKFAFLKRVAKKVTFHRSKSPVPERSVRAQVVMSLKEQGIRPKSEHVQDTVLGRLKGRTKELRQTAISVLEGKMSISPEVRGYYGLAAKAAKESGRDIGAGLIEIYPHLLAEAQTLSGDDPKLFKLIEDSLNAGDLATVYKLTQSLHQQLRKKQLPDHMASSPIAKGFELGNPKQKELIVNYVLGNIALTNALVNHELIRQGIDAVSWRQIVGSNPISQVRRYRGNQTEPLKVYDKAIDQTVSLDPARPPSTSS